MPAVYTNNIELNQPLFEAVTRWYDDYDGQRFDIGVTSLIGPPRIRMLKKRHKYEVDASDMIFILFGKLGHMLLERHSDEDAFHEERLVYELDGWRVGGQADRWAQYKVEGVSIVEDYKFTSLWTFIDGVKPEWKRQLEFYKWLFVRAANLKVDFGRIWAFYRDWSKRKRHGSNYPKYQVGKYDVSLRSVDKIERDVLERIKLHQSCVDLPDDDLPECTPEERWERPTTWAVMKKGRKSALRLFDSEEEAEKWKALNGGDQIVERPGESVRCIDYCEVMQFCNVAKRLGITPTEEGQDDVKTDQS